MVRILYLWMACLLCSAGMAQQKQVDKVQQWYTKGLYETSADRALYFLKKYKEEPELHLYVAFSDMRMLRNGNADYALQTPRMLQHTQLAHQYGGAQVFAGHKADSKLLNNFIRSYADNLYKTDPQAALEPYQLIATVFKDTTDNYRQLLAPAKPKPTNNTTAPKPAPKPVANPVAETETAPASSNAFTIENLLAFAESLMGTPYRYAGCDPKGFDCSGYVSWVFSKFGIKLPHGSQTLASYGELVPIAQAKPGDLLFFGTGNTKKYSVNHVAILHTRGEGVYYSFIHSASTGVVIDDPTTLSWDYWQKRLLFVKRLPEVQALY